MIPLHEGRFYRIIYVDGFHRDFQAINIPQAKHLITVKTNDNETHPLVDLLTDTWINLCEINEEFSDFNDGLNPIRNFILLH
jgi:hypothetical protein